MINRLKKTLREGGAAIGTFVTGESPDMVEIIALGGFDFIIIDTEHGPLSVETVKNLARAAEYRGITPVTRVTENTATQILRVLDVGSHGVQIPQVNTAGDAEKAVEASKYFPLGNRGMALARAADYGNVNALDYFANANEETLVVVHCESKECYENLEEIAKVPGVDVIFLGPFDMSQSLGIPGQIDHPKIQEISEKVVALSQKYGKAAGIFVPTAEKARMRIREGFQYIGFQMFESFVLDACKRATAAVRER